MVADSGAPSGASEQAGSQQEEITVGTLNYLRKAAEDAAKKAGAFAAEHKDTATGAVEKAATFVNTRTDGKYADTVAKAAGAAQTGVHKVAGQPAPGPVAEDPGTPLRGGVSTDGTPMTGPR
jgi:hypothetical protein